VQGLIFFTFPIIGIAYGQSNEEELKKSFIQTIQKGEIIMKNIEMTVEGNILTIKVDLTKEFGPSASGKTIIIGTTEGNISIPGCEDAKVGLNVYKKKTG
jgi:predicted membrane protein